MHFPLDSAIPSLESWPSMPAKYKNIIHQKLLAVCTSITRLKTT